ncbi:hypothetical protein Q3G72_018972 [Acer saccharum]|nr:hypothetical protein Q3G72_018972 [Acer saccharum]
MSEFVISISTINVEGEWSTLLTVTVLPINTSIPFSTEIHPSKRGHYIYDQPEYSLFNRNPPIQGRLHIR